MKIKNEYEIKNASGKSFVVNSLTQSQVEIIFNEISLFLWELLKAKHLTKTEMLELVLNRFDISTVLALGEIDTFVRTIREYGMTDE